MFSLKNKVWLRKYLNTSLALSCSVSFFVGCGVPTAENRDFLEPEGVEVGNALRAAFPTFDPANPIPVNELGLEAEVSNVEEVFATPEIQATVGIERWKIGSNIDDATTSYATHMEGFIGSVRVIAVRLHTTNHVNEQNESVADVESALAFHGHESSRMLITDGLANETTPDELEAALMPVVDFELDAVGENKNALSTGALRCALARQALQRAEANRSKACRHGHHGRHDCLVATLRVESQRHRVAQFCH